MDLQRLHTFRILSQTLHFQRAAEELGITRFAVSQQIAALEKDLGVALFERIGRRVFLTPAGQVLAQEAVKVLSTVSRARDAVGAVAKGGAGRLRVGASTSCREVLGRLRSDFPLVELDFRIAQGVRERSLEVAKAAVVGAELRTQRVPGDHRLGPVAAQEAMLPP
jgi:DNA-binding transcriptional LysR family regulator